MNSAEELAAIASLAHPSGSGSRYVRDGGVRWVGRRPRARPGSRSSSAAFHLDRMAEAGLLDVGYRRLTGRVGPGAGRTAKV